MLKSHRPSTSAQPPAGQHLNTASERPWPTSEAVSIMAGAVKQKPQNGEPIPAAVTAQKQPLPVCYIAKSNICEKPPTM